MAEEIPGYTELKLRLERGDGDTYRVVAFGPENATASESFSLPFGEMELDNFVLRVGRPRRGVRAYRSSQMEEAKRFGEQLFDALMVGEVRDVFRTAQGVAEDHEQGLRVTLYLTDVPELMGVPWEFLYERPSFLSQSIFSPVVRSLDLKRSRAPRPITLPLRILGMVSRPQGFEMLDVEREQQKLTSALAPLSEQRQVTLEWLERATLSQLEETISRRDEIHVLHYVGHGAYDERTAGGILVLEDERGNPHEVTGEEIGSLLQDKRSLQLVVLNSCEGARSSHIDPFSGVAASLVEYGIPAVIGMQFEISDEAAITFSGRLYGSLSQGYPVDAALAQARKAIFAAGNDIEFGTPVLFLRAADARLFELRKVPRSISLKDARTAAECDFELHLEQRPVRAKPGEQVIWQLAIENSGRCQLRDVTARSAAGDRLAESIELEPGRSHIVRWSEALDPELRHLITVSARDAQGSSISQQITARASVGGTEEQSTVSVRSPQGVEERAVKPGDTSRTERRGYRHNVELAWADGRLEPTEVERLEALSREMGLTPKEAAEIEREVIGRVKEEAVTGSDSSLDPTASNHLRRGEERLNQRRFDLAVKHFDQALRRAPNAPEALAGRGEAYARMHRMNDAFADFDHALEIDGHQVRALVGRARANADRYRIEQSLADSELALESDPSSSAALVARAKALANDNRDQEALTELRRAIELDPGAADPYAERGWIRIRQKDATRALADFTSALDLDPLCIEALMGRAMTQPDRKAALQELGANSNVANEPLMWTAQGFVEMDLGNPDEALRHFDEVLVMYPDAVPVVAAKASLLLIAKGDTAGAIRELDRILGFAPHHPDARAVRGAARKAVADGQAEKGLGDQVAPGYEAAQEDFEVALERPAGLSRLTVAEVHALRGQVAYALDRQDEAMNAFDTAVKIDRSCAMALTWRSKMHLDRDERDKALADARLAIKADPGSDDARFMHGLVLAIIFLAGRQKQSKRADAVARRQAANQKKLRESTLEGGWKTGQQHEMVGLLTGTETLIWLCRCRRTQDTIRQVALLVTSERLIWCRQTVLGSPELSWAGYRAMDSLVRTGTGFQVTASEANIDVGFEGIAGGTNLTNRSLELAPADVTALARAFWTAYHAD